MVKTMENPMNKWDDLGGPPLFLETFQTQIQKFNVMFSLGPSPVLCFISLRSRQLGATVVVPCRWLHCTKYVVLARLQRTRGFAPGSCRFLEAYQAWSPRPRRSYLPNFQALQNPPDLTNSYTSYCENP